MQLEEKFLSDGSPDLTSEVNGLRPDVEKFVVGFRNTGRVERAFSGNPNEPEDMLIERIDQSRG